mmetsp:Transcript_106273/g.158978  ORF Transcript_106273/g.158978 Transcript_106273/m.158978 type:complete len:173 (+) Transcript_106273:37-555(+)
MCGIEIVVTDGSMTLELWESTQQLEKIMKKRGPDFQGVLNFLQSEDQNCWIRSSVLHLRGSSITPQPLTNDKSNNFLSWNGEIFSGAIPISDQQNDGKQLFSALQNTSQNLIPELFSSIHGPFAFCYWQAETKTLWFGRDPLGRRSLLLHRSHQGNDEQSQKNNFYALFVFK